MQGGTLTVNNDSATPSDRFIVGNAGSGTFDHTGGTVNVGSSALPANLVLGNAASGNGTYNLSRHATDAATSTATRRGAAGPASSTNRAARSTTTLT